MLKSFCSEEFKQVIEEQEKLIEMNLEMTAGREDDPANVSLAE